MQLIAACHCAATQSVAVMQASFHPNETIQDVMDHVTKCLDDQYKASQFYLYVTPPTQKLAATKTLVELNLVPAALTYLSWLEMPPRAEVMSVGFYFCGDVVIRLKHGGLPAISIGLLTFITLCTAYIFSWQTNALSSKIRRRR